MYRVLIQSVTHLLNPFDNFVFELFSLFFLIKLQCVW